MKGTGQGDEFLKVSCGYIGGPADEAFGREGRGTLIGVFHHGWYFGNEQFVWLLHDQAYGSVPFGVGIEDFERAVPYQKDLEGAEVVWRETEILIPKAGVALQRCPPERKRAEQQIGLKELRRMRERAVPILMEKGRGTLRDLLKEQETLLNGGADQGPAKTAEEDLFLRYARKKLIAFFETLKTEDPDRIGSSLRKLIGFGSGLTPSMDDWLTGFLYVLLRARVSAAAREQIGQLANLVLSVVPDCTNRISAAYVSAAAKGMYFQQMHRVLCAVSDAEAEQLLQFGSSSGSDMMTGMMFAACYLEQSGNLKNT